MDSAKRAKAFSDRDIDVITDFMKRNIHKLRADHGSGGPGMFARVREIWSELLAGVNAEDVADNLKKIPSSKESKSYK
ncbi:hypothetical protein DPMN_136417 [Dreissena polymorpha]|uniref:Uncharacterized protein n=1 Tax=Dreissena polymorpha TaxID=45954 RepID=A0A9D4JGP6_DREPO|nr:hypothetical protein DPMN_136417 [Dreissena polymorpha]